MQRIITFDIDMTLLDNEAGGIPASALEAIKKMRARGHIIVIATGRDMMTGKSTEIVDIVKPEAIIHLNGSKVSVGEEVIHKKTIEKDVFQRLVDLSLEKRYVIGLSRGSLDYYFNQDKFVEYELEKHGGLRRPFGDPYELFNFEIGNLLYIGEAKGAYDIEDSISELRCVPFIFGFHVMPKDSSKGRGLEILSNYYGIDMANTVSFGDSYNDMEIIKAAGIGVAMGNAKEELKEVADYVTSPVGQDGIYNACLNLGLFD